MGGGSVGDGLKEAIQRAKETLMAKVAAAAAVADKVQSEGPSIKAPGYEAPRPPGYGAPDEVAHEDGPPGYDAQDVSPGYEAHRTHAVPPGYDAQAEEVRFDTVPIGGFGGGGSGGWILGGRRCERAEGVGAGG